MSRINLNNSFEAISMMQASKQKSASTTNAADIDKSAFLSILNNGNNKSQQSVDELLVNDERNALSQTQKVLKKILDEPLVGLNQLEQKHIPSNQLLDKQSAAGIGNSEILNWLANIKPQLIGNTSDLITELKNQLKAENNTITEQLIDYANNENNLLGSGLNNIDLVVDNLDKLALIMEQNPSSDKIFTPVLANVFSNQNELDTTILVQGHADENKSILQIWVPLTSVATGRLSQSLNQLMVEAVYSSNDLKVNSRQVAGENPLINNQADTQFLFARANLTHSQQNFVTAMLAVNAKVSHSVDKEIERTNSAQYSSNSAQLNQELLTKKYTFFNSDDGLSIWYRDYQSSEQSILSELEQIKALLEKYSKVKLIGFNGNIIYSGDAEKFSINGEKNAR